MITVGCIINANLLQENIVFIRYEWSPWTRGLPLVIWRGGVVKFEKKILTMAAHKNKSIDRNQCEK